MKYIRALGLTMALALLGLVACQRLALTPTPVMTSGAPQASATSTLLPSATATPSPSATPTMPPNPTPTPLPAELVACYPLQGDRAVRAEQPLVLVFDQPMDAASVQARLTLSPTLPMAITWPSPERLEIRPEVSWPAGTWIELHLVDGATSRAGGVLARGLDTRFRTDGPGVPLPILMYHHIVELNDDATEGQRAWSVSPKALAEQMDYLMRNGWCTVQPAQVVAYLRDGTPLPPRSVVVSMDDGYREVYDLVLPLLRDTGLRPVLLIVPSYVEYGGYLDWEQLAALAQAGFGIGSHSYDHTALRGADDTTLELQIVESRRLIEGRLGITVDTFCYPYGSYDQRTLDKLEAEGYLAGLTLNPTWTQKPQEPLLLSRLAVTYTMTLDDFAELLPQ